jgi:RNA polymerase sigma-70 factor, ECF subfamily
MERIDRTLRLDDEIFKIKVNNLNTMISVKNRNMTDNLRQIGNRITTDKSLFEQSFRDHYDGMYRYCMTMVRDQADAEDIVQSVFTDFWQDRHKIDIHTSIQAYLYKGVYFKCMNRIKRDKVTQKYITTLPTDDGSSAQSDPAILEEVSVKITKSIEALPEQCRKIFTLNRYDGMRYQEIADHLQLSVKTIENQMGKALKILRINLSDYLHVSIFHFLTYF